LNKPYSTTLAAIGGQPPYGWTLTSGTLPTGLSLDKNTGVISGTPTVLGTSPFFAITVTDAAKNFASAKFTITIKAAGAVMPYGAGLGCSPQSGPACPLAPDGSYSWSQVIPDGSGKWPIGPFTDAQITVSDGGNFSAQFSTDAGASWSPLLCQSLGQMTWDCLLPVGTNKIQAKATPIPPNSGGLAVDIILQ
jgi:hypothetical protein